jgi:hypothetical protein
MQVTYSEVCAMGGKQFVFVFVPLTPTLSLEGRGRKPDTKSIPSPLAGEGQGEGFPLMSHSHDKSSFLGAPCRAGVSPAAGRKNVAKLNEYCIYH